MFKELKALTLPFVMALYLSTPLNLCAMDVDDPMDIDTPPQQTRAQEITRQDEDYQKSSLYDLRKSRNDLDVRFKNEISFLVKYLSDTSKIESKKSNDTERYKQHQNIRIQKDIDDSNQELVTLKNELDAFVKSNETKVKEIVAEIKRIKLTLEQNQIQDKELILYCTSLLSILPVSSASQNTAVVDWDNYNIHGNFGILPHEILWKILNQNILENCYILGHTKGLHSVCKGFYEIIRYNLQLDLKTKVDGFFNLDKLCLSSMQENETSRLRNIKLIFKKGTPEEVILSIPANVSPIGYTFDLSKCALKKDETADKYLSISIGYRKFKNPANKHKVELWIAPRFMAQKDIAQGKADHLKVIFPEKWPEESSLALIWTGGWWNDMTWCDYLTNESVLLLNNGDNVYEKWKKSPLFFTHHRFDRFAYRPFYQDACMVCLCFILTLN